MRGIKNKGNSKWKKWGISIILLLIFFVLLNSMINVYQKKKVAQETLVRMEEEKAKLENRDQLLKTSIERMSTKEGVEFEIRKKLNVAASGESVAIIVDEEASSSAGTTAVSSWQKLKDFFGGLFK